MNREEWRNGLMNGDKVAVYPALRYVLINFQMLQLRAYLGRFIQRIEVPSEFSQDANIQQLQQENEELRKTFIDIHKELEKKKETAQNPQELIKDINTLTEEKKQLESKIEGMKLRNKNYEGFDELLDATRELRHQQEEEQRLQDRIYEQQSNYEQCKMKKEDAIFRYREMKTVEENSSTPQEMLDALQNEVDRFKVQALTNLPATLKDKEKTLNELRQMASAPRTENDIRMMQSQVEQYQNDIAQMRNEIEQLKSNGNSQLEIYKKKVSQLQKEITKKEKELDEEKQEKQSVENEIKSNQEAYQRAQRFKKYREVLLQTTEKYKGLKQELEKIQAETVILDRTVKVLQERDEHYEDIVSELERIRGVSGARAVKDQIEVVSNEKSKSDEDKAKILEELSKQIEQVKAQLDAKKNILGPQVYYNILLFFFFFFFVIIIHLLIYYCYFVIIYYLLFIFIAIYYLFID